MNRKDEPIIDAKPVGLIVVGALKIGDWILVCDAPQEHYYGERVFPPGDLPTENLRDCVFAPVLNIFRDANGRFEIAYGFGDSVRRHIAPDWVVVLATEEPPTPDPAEAERSREDTHEITVLIHKLREIADEIAEAADQAQRSAADARSEAENAESYADDAFKATQGLTDMVAELQAELDV